MPKVLKIAGVSVIALGLVLGLTLPALAAPPWADDSQIEVVRGKVISVGDQGFVIQSGEEELTISVDENTKYFKLRVPGRIVALARHWMQFGHQNQEEIGAQGEQDMESGLQNQARARAAARHQMRLQTQISQPENVPLSELPRLKWLRPFGEGAEFSDIEVGDRVAVWLADGDNLAQRVLITKPTTYASISGAITAISPSTITITPEDGEAVILDYNGSTVFILNGITQVEAGQYALAIYDSDNMVAKRVTVPQELP